MCLDANDEPVFYTYRNDPPLSLAIAGITKGEPEYDFTTDDGVSHTVWVVTDTTLISALTEAFARIPNHKTGAPVLATPWEIQAARARRQSRRAWVAAARRLRVPHQPWSRAYADEPGAWGRPEARVRIEGTIGRTGSLAHELFGAPMGELERVMRWCMSLGLPVKIRDLGQLDLAQPMKAAEKACDPNDSMSSMPFQVTPKMVLDAMKEVDRLGASLK